MDDPLRETWDFGDLDATEARFRLLLEAAAEDDARSQILTQLARVEGLRARFADADALLDQAECLAASPLARARMRLERGRVRNSAGDPADALPLFEAAWEEAGGSSFVAADAAHMAAIAAPDLDGARLWTERGVSIAEQRPDAAGHWLGPLHNNLGWEQLEAGEAEAALESFRRALAARQREPERRMEIEIARYAVAKALRALGRPEEAVAELEPAVAWADAEGAPDGWFHEELALAYADLGRGDDAVPHARAALRLLPDQDPSWKDESERAAALGALAGE